MAWTDYYVDQSDDSASNGAGTTGDPWTSLRAAVAEIGAIAGPTRIFVRGSGTTLGSALTISTTGTTANPVLWIGCTGTGTTWTRIGDDASATKPSLATSTYNVTISGAYNVFEGLAFSGTSTSALLRVTGGYNRFKRCRAVNAGSHNNARACIFEDATGCSAIACYFECASTVADAALSLGGAGCVAFGNVCKNGDLACIQAIGSGCLVAHNICYGGTTTTNGIQASATGLVAVIGNTIFGCQEDGIEFTAGYGCVINNLIHGGSGSVTDYPIRFSGTATHNVTVAYNAWFNCANNEIAGIVETQSPHAGASADYGNLVWNYGLLGGNPLPNASSLGAADDFDLAVAYQRLAFPGTFEAGAYAFVGRMSHGAVQPLPDFPTAGNVHNDDTVDGVTGTLTLPAAEDVENGVQYGAGGTEFTGTLVGGGGGGGGPLIGGRLVQ